MSVPIDGQRGTAGLGGWWIDHKEAKEYARQEEWWKATLSDGTHVLEQQYDQTGPNDKPFWLFKNGDMYLGPWTKDDDGNITEEGLGITYNNRPKHVDGKCYLGHFKQGMCHGFGRSFWVTASPIWKNNHLPGSEITATAAPGKKRTKGLPYEYVGRYTKNIKDDAHATVTLKDGTKKSGAWKHGKPIVCTSWWQDHRDEEQDNHDENSVVTEADSIAVAATTAEKAREEEEETTAVIATAAGTAREEEEETTKKPAPVETGKVAAVPAATTTTKETLKHNRECEPRVAAVEKKQHHAKAASSRKKESKQTATTEVASAQAKSKRERRSTAGTQNKKKEQAVKKAKLEHTCEDERKREPIVKQEEEEDEDEDNEDLDGSDKILNIARILERDAIGCGAARSEMTMYAKNLVTIGCHSIEFIRLHCEDQDVDGWDWMKPMHRKAFKKWLMRNKKSIVESTTDHGIRV